MSMLELKNLSFEVPSGDGTKKIIDNAVSTFKVSGIVVSNLSELEILPDIKLDIIGNYVFGIAQPNRSLLL